MKFNFEKPLSQEATDTHIVRNILKLNVTVGSYSIKSHSAMNYNILNTGQSLFFLGQSLLPPGAF